MRSHKFWWPVIASLAATPVFLFLLVASAGVGHSDNRGPAYVLFPYALLASNLFGTKDMPFFALLVVQYPLYGLALGAAGRRGAAVSSWRSAPFSRRTPSRRRPASGRRARAYVD